MDVYFVAFVSALIGTLSATEFIRVLAIRLRAVDQPGGRRVHRRPTARLGGLGIYWGLCAALGLATYGQAHWAAPLHSFDPGLLGMLGMLIGGGCLLIVGLLDDVHGMAAITKLGCQAAAALMLYAFGWRVETVGLPLIGAWPVGALSLPLTVGWVVLVTNALNLIDGLDGLACGVALAASVAAAALLWHTQGPALLAAVALAGALAGFLWFNLSPALIFMGDAGSLLVGFALAAITLRAGQVASHQAFPLVPAVLLAVPLFDTFDAIRRRTVSAARVSSSILNFLSEALRRVLSPDGLHVHHRLIRAGLSTRRAVALLWGAAASFALSGCMMGHDLGLGLLVLGAMAAGWSRGLLAVESRLRRPAARPPAVAPAPRRVVDGEPAAESLEAERQAA